MKTISLRLNDTVFTDTDKIVSTIHKPRNKYINEALDCYNKVQKKALLAKKLEQESKIVNTESMKVLAEFEALHDND